MFTTTINPAQQILNQLGGNKFKAMTGATCYSDTKVFTNDTLVVKFKGSRVANIMYVTLTENDTYTLSICKYRNLEVKPVKELDMVYADQLRTIFEDVTKLRTSL